IGQHQRWIHFCDFFGNQTKLRRGFGVRLVVERDWSERHDCFTGFIHGGDVLLEPLRRGYRPQLPAVGHNHWRRRAALRSHAIDVGNPSRVVHVRASGVCADTRDVIGRGDTVASSNAQGGVEAAGGVGIERVLTDSRIGVAGAVALERTKTDSRVADTDGIVFERISSIGGVVIAGGVELERILTGGGVAVAGGVVSERVITIGSVEAAGGVAEEGERSISRVVAAAGIANESKRPCGRILRAGSVTEKRACPHGGILVCGVDKERPSANGVVEAGSSVAPKRKETDCRIVSPGGETKKSALPFCRIATRIASIGRRTDRLHCRQKAEANQRDEKYWNSFFKLNQWIHGSSFLFPRRVVSAIAGLEEAKNLAGEILRLIQISFNGEAFFTKTVRICIVR